MKKLVVKAEVKDIDSLVEQLSRIDLEFGGVKMVHDRVYIPRNYNPKSNFPRLVMRTEKVSSDSPVRYILILKRHLEESGLDIENATVVKDYAESVGIIQQLSFVKQAEINRRRQTLTLSPGVKLCLDQIDELHKAFIKIETEIVEGDDIKSVKDDLLSTLSALGLDNISKDTNAELCAK